MNIVITGAHGFVGQALTKRLLAGAGPREWRDLTRLTLVDLDFAATVSAPASHVPDARIRHVSGSIADPAVVKAALEGPVDVVFHLASIPGGAAEKDYALGRRINLDATLDLLEGLRVQPRPPRVVFASSVAVYGEQLPARMDEATLPAPALTYGAHKLIAEALVADASRLGWIDGCSLRLPGVVARPPGPSGLMSAFMSELFWALRDGRAIELPVSEHAVAWWISVGRCAENLLHAATLDSHALNARRSYAMPVLRLTMAEVVEALARRFGAPRRALVSYRPDARIERLFGAYPPFDTPHALAIGLRHDGDADALVEHALAG
ncbi:MAG: NAD-dependent epimerase/dehydratase family protein [Janthinobacterium lividum]